MYPSRAERDFSSHSEIPISQAFATPKPQSKHSRLPSRTHRNKSGKSVSDKNTLEIGTVEGGNGISFSRNGDGVPTALVPPQHSTVSSVTPHHSTASSVPPQHSTISTKQSALSKYPSEENIRSNYDKELPSSHRSYKDFRRSSDHLSGIDKEELYRAREAWSPDFSREITKHREDEFRGLDPHISQISQRDTDTSVPDPYKTSYGHKRDMTMVTSDLSQQSKFQDRSGGVPVTSYSTNTSYHGYSRDNISAGQYESVAPAPSSSYGHSVTSERSYGYTGSRTVDTPVYNPQAYSVTESSAVPNYSSNTVPSQVVGGDHFASDLTSWQQKHQEALRRQQIEVAHPMLSMAPAQYIHTGQTAASSLLLRDPHKLDAIKLAADNIIKEKDMIIERQKGKIIDLERRTKDTEVEKQKDLLRRARDNSDNLGVKLQEYQYENTSLKAQIAEFAAAKKDAQEDAERKLGAAEYELRQLKQKINREGVSRTDEIKLLTNKLAERDDQISECKDKLRELTQQKEVLQGKLTRLEGYMDDLPTVDEHSQQTAEIRSLKEDKIRYKQRFADMEKKLADTQKGIKSRDGLIETLESNEGKLKAQFLKLEADNQALREKLTKSGCPVDDIDDLQFENKQLKTDLEKAKKLLETKQKRQQQIDAHHRTELSNMEERLNQEESAVTALREEILAKDQNLVKLRQSFKELGSENQDLLQKNMAQRDQIQELESQLTGDIRKVENRLMKEITVCFSELQSLVQICVQHAEGQDPNISALLGVKSSAGEVEPDVEAKDLASLKFKVGKVREMRNEIDKLRELISNKYAEDMGDNLNCTTQ